MEDSLLSQAGAIIFLIFLAIFGMLVMYGIRMVKKYKEKINEKIKKIKK